GAGSPRPARTDARRTAGWRGGGRGSFVRRRILYQRFELRGVHHGAEALGHDPGELLVALRDGRRRVEDLLADRLRVAPRADVREIGRDHLALPVQLVTGEAPCGLLQTEHPLHPDSDGRGWVL